MLNPSLEKPVCVSFRIMIVNIPALNRILISIAFKNQLIWLFYPVLMIENEVK